ncbi:MAG: hypothetical protein ACK4NC_04960 [Candidatus Gracilibacteria bacterium]
MDIRLSWDLFVIVFLSIVLAYSFIVGRKQTIKIIIAIHLAFLAVDSFSYFLSSFGIYGVMAKMFSTDLLLTAIIFKCILFIILIVLLARHHAFDVNIDNDSQMFGGYFLSTALIGAFTAALMLVVIFYFTSGYTLSFLNTNTTSSSLVVIRNQSYLARFIIDNAHIWFFLPTMALLALMFNKE